MSTQPLKPVEQLIAEAKDLHAEMEDLAQGALDEARVYRGTGKTDRERSAMARYHHYARYENVLARLIDELKAQKAS